MVRYRHGYRIYWYLLLLGFMSPDYMLIKFLDLTAKVKVRRNITPQLTTPQIFWPLPGGTARTQPTPRCRNQTSSNFRALGLYHVVAVIKTSSNCRALGLHPVTMAIQNNNTNTDVTFPRKAKTLKRNAKSRKKVTNWKIPPKNIAKTLFNKTLFFSFC